MMKLMIIQLIQTYSLQYGVNPNIAISVAAVESQFNPTTIGITGDIGVFQLN
jgi:soluble lytic murein transglycosylase-like protein